jgi:hypothetical protein
MAVKKWKIERKLLKLLEFSRKKNDRVITNKNPQDI